MDFKIQVENITFCYGQSNILDKIFLNILPGKFMSIIGPNGSGKSTLLKNIAHILEPDFGSVKVEGRNIADMKRKEISRKIAVVPQNTSIEFDFKVKDVVMMGRHPYIRRFSGETSKDKEVVKKYMTYTNTLHLAEKSFSELSGGEKQRVILAQALAQETDIIILDEPVSHLDLQHQIEILDLIKRMCIKNELTALAVLHDLNLASTYSDYMAVMKSGMVYKEGLPVDVLTKETIKQVFNVDAQVTISPVSGKPYIYTMEKNLNKRNGIKIHVICGGGSGYNIIAELFSKGFEVSTGVLNIGDLDWSISKDYELDMAEEVPFLDITDKSYVNNLELLKKCDCILLTDCYFSKSNIKNLQILLEEELNMKPIFIMGDETFCERDYSQGEAQTIYEEIKRNRLVFITDKGKLWEDIEKAGELYEKGE